MTMPHAMVKTFADALISAEPDALYGGGRTEATPPHVRQIT
ncbi:hypothetical protein SALBM311S_05015 [Streptomyces alboniger]